MTNQPTTNWDETLFAQKTYRPTPNGLLQDAARRDSIFELEPQEKDFEPTLPLTAEINAYLAYAKDMAGEITRNYDELRRAEKEAKGQAWQNSRRGTKKATADRREAAEAPLRKAYIHRALLRLHKENRLDQPAPPNQELSPHALALQNELEKLLTTNPNPTETKNLLDQHEEEFQQLLSTITIEEKDPKAWAETQALLLHAHHTEATKA